MTTEAITPLRQRMIEDMSSRKLCVHTQRSHIYSCKRFAAWSARRVFHFCAERSAPGPQGLRGSRWVLAASRSWRASKIPVENNQSRLQSRSLHEWMLSTE
jgi:hypothetical protein